MINHFAVEMEETRDQRREADAVVQGRVGYDIYREEKDDCAEGQHPSKET